jgi:hypothetical protein
MELGVDRGIQLDLLCYFSLTVNILRIRRKDCSEAQYVRGSSFGFNLSQPGNFRIRILVTNGINYGTHMTLLPMHTDMASRDVLEQIALGMHKVHAR